MYTIKEASARTGLGAPVIRAWERRYGVVTPARTPAGYRLYDDEALRILVAMRALIEGGWTASEAARAIATGEVAPDAPPPAGAGPAVRGETAEAPGLPAADHRDRLVARFVSAAERASSPETEAVLDEMLAGGSYEAVVDDMLLPAAAALGDAWAEGRISVAAEHAASAAMLRRLAAVYQGAGVAGPTTVVVGLPPGSRHEIGALAFAAALRRRGVGVLYLGPDVTVEGWLDAVGRTKARAAVIGIVTAADRKAARTVAGTLIAHGVPLVALGGAAAAPGLVAGDLVLVVPDRVVDAAATVAAAIVRRR